MKKFGETIRELREKKGLLLRQVAAELEIDTALISKMERGERKAQRDQVDQIARLLETDVNNLLIVWLSDKIVEVLDDEPLALQVLKVTEKRIKRN